MQRGEVWARLLRDHDRINSIGYESEVFLEGFFLEEIIWAARAHPKTPVISGSFPYPWQSLSPAERKYRADIRNDIKVGELTPVENCGDVTTAEFLLEKAKEYLDQYREAEMRVHQKHPGVGGGTLRRAGKLPPYCPKASILWDDGSESTIVKIEWAHFTDDQIVDAFRKWLKSDRPKTVGKPDRRGHKRISERVKLEQLGIMRLLHRFTLKELRTACPRAWKHYNTANRRWHRDAKKARACFHSFFPFLSDEENPISWPPKR